MPNNKSIFNGLLVAALIFASLWVVWKMTASATQKAAEPQNITISSSDNIKGDSEAPITLVEYSDFQCPACRLYAPVVTQVITDNPDVRFVHRHFPLDQHEFAVEAAQAAEAAAKQDAFFTMHDLLFEKQDEWSASKDIRATLEEYAQVLELNLEQFKQDYASAEVKSKIESDKTSGMTLQVNSTPTFYLNGVKIQPQSAADFSTLIEAERQKLPESSADATGSGQVEDLEATPSSQ